jgi:polyisoprenoid-binding protein YceI
MAFTKSAGAKDRFDSKNTFMKSMPRKMITAFVLLLLTAGLFSFKSSAPATYKVNAEQSLLRWTGYYLFSFSEHNGTIGLSGGEISVGDQNSISGYFDIDMTSIRNLDMQPDNGGKDLENHLKSDDFFHAVKFPTARFQITKVEKIKDAVDGGPNYDVTGDLTIKDVKNTLTFPALVKFVDNGIEASAKFKFDRTKWNVRYNSGKFFSDIGDGAISDAIGMDIRLLTVK